MDIIDSDNTNFLNGILMKTMEASGHSAVWISTQNFADCLECKQ